MSTLTVRRPTPVPQAVEIYDTTLRDGSPARGHLAHRRRQAAHRRAARPPRRALHRGRLAGRQPEGRRVLPPGAAASSSSPPSTLVAFGSTRRPKGKVDDDADAAPTSSRRAPSTVCIVGKCWDYHVTEALQTTLDEGVAMVGRLGRVPARRRACEVLFDAEHFFDGYKRNPEFSAAGARGGGAQRAPTRSCCATPTAARCPTRSSAIVAEVVDHFGDDVTVGVHLHDDTGCGVANALAGVRAGATPGAGHDQRLRRAHRQLQPHHDHPEPHAEDGRARRSPTDRLERLTSVSHHIAELVNITLEPAAALRRLVGVRPQGRPARAAPSPGAPTPTSTSTPSRSATAPASWCRELAGRVDAQLKAERARPRPRRQGARRRGRQLKRLEHEGYHFEAADGSLELLMRQRRGLGAATSSRSSRSGSISRRRRADGELRHRGHREGARRRRAGDHAPPRATARSTPSTPPCAPPSAALPGARPHAPHRLQGAGARHRQGHRRRHPGAASTPPTASARGPPSACRRTSSRPRGRRSSTRSSTACSTRAS